MRAIITLNKQLCLFSRQKPVHKISQSALNDLLLDVSTMISDHAKYVENQVRHYLQGSSSSSSTLVIKQSWWTYNSLSSTQELS